MGFFDRILGTTVTASEQTPTIDVEASLAPYYPEAQPFFGISGTTTTRTEAMTVPTIARSLQIIQTVGTLPMECKNEMTGESVTTPRIINQPDPRIPGTVFWSWIVSDLFFHPSAYAYVMERYADTGRIRAMERIAPERITIQVNALATEITAYMIDGKPVDPNNLVVFPGWSEGLLTRAGRTITAAAALEQAARDFALNPIPLMVLSSNGTSLPPDRVSKIMGALRGRKRKSEVFLNADVKLDTLGFDPKSLQMNEARNYLALELARACGLPAYFVDAQQSTFTYSNALDKRRDLVDFAFRNYIVAIEQRMSFADFVPAGTVVRVDVDDFLRGNPGERAAFYETMARIGAMTVDEIREEEEMIL